MIKRGDLVLFLDLDKLEKIPKHRRKEAISILIDWINNTPIPHYGPLRLDDLTLKRIDWVVWEMGYDSDVINTLRTITLHIRNHIYSVLGLKLPNGETVIRETTLTNTKIKNIKFSPNDQYLIITINTLLCCEQPKLEYCA